MGNLGFGLEVYVAMLVLGCNLFVFDCFGWILYSDVATDSMDRFLFVVRNFPFTFVHAWGAGHMTSLVQILVFFCIVSSTIASFSSGAYLFAREMEFAVV